MKTAVWIRLVIFLVATLPFLASWNYPYINIDDPQYYVLPPEITNGLSLRGFNWAVKDISNAIWMPLTWLVYQVDYSLRNLILSLAPSLDGFQLAYSIAHIQSIVLHGLNAVLLYGFLLRLAPLKGHLIPALAALVWAIHPLRVESVVWIASLKDVLSMTFLLAGLSAWISFRRTDKSPGIYVLAHVFFALACCAKPSVMTFPAMLLLLDATMLGKITLKPLRRQDFKAYVPSICIAVPVALLAQIAQSAGGATNFLSQVPLGYRALNALVSIGVYVRNTFCPTKLAVQCQMQWPNPPHDLTNGIIIGSVVLLTAFFFATRIFIRIQKGEVVTNATSECGLLWAVGTMFPMLGLSAFGGHAFADRFTYIPLVGLSIAILGLKERFPTSALTGGGAATLAVLAGLTVRQTRFWENDRKLVEQTLAIDGDNNILAHLNIFRHIFEHEHTPDQLPLAIRHFQRAQELDSEMCQSSTIIYMMLLGECSEMNNLRQLERNFSDWVLRRYNLTKTIDTEIANGLCDLYGQNEYLNPETGKQRARDLASRLLAKGDHGIYQIDYFAYLVGKETDDQALMHDAKVRIHRLANPRTGHDNSIRFRFIDKD